MASALRNAHRPLNLSDNLLIDHEGVRRMGLERYPNNVMREELALSDLALQCGQAVLERIAHDERLRTEAIVLETVLANGSVQAAARRIVKSREHVSNTAWRVVTLWVLDEFERRLVELSRSRDDRVVPLRRGMALNGSRHATSVSDGQYPLPS